MMWPDLTVFSRTALRLPRKGCGLFDTGHAGGTYDVTSVNYDASTEPLVDGFSANSSIFDVYAENKSDTVWNMTNNAPDLLSDIHIDQLADENLDAFINLDQYLQDLFSDDITDQTPDEVFQTQDTMIPTSTESNIFPVQASTKCELYTQTSAINNLTFEPITGMFEIPMHENMVDFSHQGYDWMGQFKNISTTEVTWKHTTHEDSQKTSVLKSTLSSGDSSTWSDSLDSHIQDTATDKSTAVRNKNRDPSQKSRERRKTKYTDLDDEAAALIETNAKLRKRIIELEEMTKKMKAQLISSIVGN